MARLHEYQGKTLLHQHGLLIPKGGAAATPAEAVARAREIGGPVVIKIQAFMTGRAAIGGVAFASSAAEVEAAAARLLAITVGSFPVTHVIVEERIDIAREFFLSVSIDDQARAPVVLLAESGGTGIEERAASVTRVSCTVGSVDEAALAGFISRAGLGAAAGAFAAAVRGAFAVARTVEARSVEINPLVITKDGRVVAADCRMTIDDYAVFRHPELGIDIARELDHPPTALERAAYDVEQADHRGTFFFAQMNTSASPGSKGLIGFHGAGGGGSMMSMDAITTEGFTIANFCDTSGNPSPAKVYRAARIILEQPGLIGYFGSGSGVANQEQFWSAYGLAKAFYELDLDIPAVIRLGGNTEDRAVEILQRACKGLRAPVEGYRKTDPPAKIAARFGELVAQHRAKNGGTLGWQPRAPKRPAFVGAVGTFTFAVKGGVVHIDARSWASHRAAIIARTGGLFKDDGGRPALAVAPEAFLGKDNEMIAAEVECRMDGVEGVFVELGLEGAGK